jgi:predicted XRE-type DNA-binding protein
MNVELWNGGKGKRITVHRLVAQHFIPNPENKPEVNHLNGVKTDNSVDNLEWVTSQENIIHSWENGHSKKRFGEENYHSKLKESEVIEIVTRYNQEKITQTELSREYEVNQSTISRIVNGDRWQHLLT